MNGHVKARIALVDIPSIQNRITSNTVAKAGKTPWKT
jgi:hypothetical protein